MNEEWTRWAEASIAQYIQGVATTLEINFTLGQLDSAAALESSDYINIRTSVLMNQLTASDSEIIIGLVVLLHYVIDADVYKGATFKGAINKALNQCVPFLQTGYPESPNTTISYFQLSGKPTILDLNTKDATARARECVFTASLKTLLQEI